MFHFFAFKKAWGALAICLRSLSIFTMKHYPISFLAFGWMWSERCIHFRFHLAKCVSSYINDKPQWNCFLPLHNVWLMWFRMFLHMSKESDSRTLDVLKKKKRILLWSSFNHQGKDSPITEFSCLLWSFDSLELTSGFFFKNPHNCWAVSVLLLSDRYILPFQCDALVHLQWYLHGLHVERSSQTAGKCWFSTRNQLQLPSSVSFAMNQGGNGAHLHKMSVSPKA